MAESESQGSKPDPSVAGIDELNGSEARYLVFAEFHVDLVERQLYRGEEAIHLTPKGFELLVVFLGSPGELLTREVLFERIWGERIVEDSNLTQTVFLLRHTLGDEGGSRRFIATEPGRGYRFVGTVTPADEDPRRTTDDSGSRWAAPLRALVGNRWLVASAIGVAVMLLGAFFVLTVRDEPAKSLAEIGSIAVLPFVDLATNEPSPLGVGFADAVTTELAVRTDLAVRPLSTVIDYARASETSADAGRNLLVDAILVGTLLHQEDEVRISMQILDPEDGRTLWASSSEHPRSDLFGLQGVIARRVARSAFPESREETASASSVTMPGTDRFDAYEELMTGRYHLASRSAEAMMLARDAFRRALEIDARYAEAWSDLSSAELLLGFYSLGEIPPRERCRRARNAGQNALGLRPDLASAHVTFGMIELFCALDFERSELHFRRGVDLAPDSARAYHWYAWLALSTGDERLGAELLDKAREIDPLSLIARSARARLTHLRGGPEEAVRLYDSILTVDPGFGRAHLNRGLALGDMGRLDEAELAFRRAEELLGPTDEVRSASARLQVLQGSKTLEEALAGIEAPIERAYVHAAGGNEDVAIDLILESVERREAWIWLLRADPRLDSVRGHPDFERVEEAVGIPLR